MASKKISTDERRDKRKNFGKQKQETYQTGTDERRHVDITSERWLNEMIHSLDQILPLK